MRDVVDLLIEVSGFRGDITWNTDRPDGQMHRRFDTSKARADLGWEARTPLREGLEKTVAWYRDNRETARK